MGDALALNPGYGLSKFDLIAGTAKNLAANISAGVSKKFMPAKSATKELHTALPLAIKADLIECTRDYVKVLEGHGVTKLIRELEAEDDGDVGVTILKLSNQAKLAIDANPSLKKTIESLKTEIASYAGAKGHSPYTMIQLIRDVIETEIQNLHLGFFTGSLIAAGLAGALGWATDVAEKYATPPPAPRPPSPPPPSPPRKKK